MKKENKVVEKLMDIIYDGIYDDFNQEELAELKNEIFGFDFETKIGDMIEKSLSDFESEK